MFNKSCLIKKYMLYGVIAIVLISSLSHFLYGFSGNIKIVGIFTPINESIWEHLKLAFYPTVLWWGIGYFIYRGKMYIDIRKWIVSMAISIIISPIIIITFFFLYLYRCLWHTKLSTWYIFAYTGGFYRTINWIKVLWEL